MKIFILWKPNTIKLVFIISCTLRIFEDKNYLNTSFNGSKFIIMIKTQEITINTYPFKIRDPITTGFIVDQILY